MDTTEKLLIGGVAVVALYFLIGRKTAGAIELPAQTQKRVMDQHAWIWGAGVDQGVEPAIIAALIDVESSGDPDARGAAGEVGLMQILPATGKWICTLSEQQLRDPIFNIRCGTKYLRYNLDEFGGNVAASLCGYNAGTRNVWIDETRSGKIVAPGDAKRYSRKVMERVPAYREVFRRQYPAYYGMMFRPDKWFLNFNQFDGLGFLPAPSL